MPQKTITIKKTKVVHKKPELKEKAVHEGKESVQKSGKYFQAIGRRKTAIARVRLFAQGDKTFVVNGKDLNSYFSIAQLGQIAKSPLDKMNCSDKFQVTVVVNGGGIHAQAEAIRHAISRALVLFNLDFRKKLKTAGFLTRDPRMRERKKFGLKRARKSPQWAKR